MSDFDLLIRGGKLVGPATIASVDVGVVAGSIAAIGPELQGSAHASIDATGLHLLPGTIDAHVHLNEPGRGDWEGWSCGTSALAVGGATSCVEMPLNANPPTVSAKDFDLKLRAAAQGAHVDFGLWGGIVPGNRHELAELAQRGVVGFKAFMCDSGLKEFPRSDELTLYEGMIEAARLGLPVLVHAESEAITTGLKARAHAAGTLTAADYAATRPAVAELAAIAQALELAEAAGCALHVVHVSTGRGVEMIAAARARGVDASCETCPHYLTLTAEDAARLGTVAKCGPPLRSVAERERLWDLLSAGLIDIVVSDHSPAPAAAKQGPFLDAWGGIAGAQQTTELLVGDGYNARGLKLTQIAALLSGTAARRFSLRNKGELIVGGDADIALIDLNAERTLKAEELLSRHRLSPYVGRKLRCRVVRTILRGRTIAEEGRIVGRPQGRLLRPAALTQLPGE